MIASCVSVPSWNALEAALEEARRGQRLDIQGFVSQPDGCSGLWPDGWAGATLATRLVPTRPARSIRLQLWAPPHLAGSQRLRIELDRQSHEFTLSPGDVTAINLPIDGHAGRDIDLRVHAERLWHPAAVGDSSDQRELAYRVVAVVVE